jgi:hypothetical protein
VESPVTKTLKSLAQKELESIRGADIGINLVRGEPQKTQENLVENVTQELEWITFVELLEGDWTVMEEENE